jgi:hypothetical protein
LLINLFRISKSEIPRQILIDNSAEYKLDPLEKQSKFFKKGYLKKILDPPYCNSTAKRRSRGSLGKSVLYEETKLRKELGDRRLKAFYILKYRTVLVRMYLDTWYLVYIIVLGALSYHPLFSVIACPQELVLSRNYPSLACFSRGESSSK